MWARLSRELRHDDAQTQMDDTSYNIWIPRLPKLQARDHGRLQSAHFDGGNSRVTDGQGVSLGAIDDHGM